MRKKALNREKDLFGERDLFIRNEDKKKG